MADAARLGPKIATPFLRSASGDTRDERRLGADDDEVGVELAREPEQPFGVLGAHGMAVARAARCRGCRARNAARSARGSARSSTRARARALPTPRGAPSRDESIGLRNARARARARLRCRPGAPAPRARARRTRRTPARRPGSLVVERLAPAFERLVDGAAVVEVGLVRGEVRRLGSVGQQIAHADGDLREGREHVELRQRERREAVQPHGVAQRDEVEPAAAALAAGDGAELAAELAQLLLLRRRDLARERPCADAGDVRLRDADDLVEAVGADADARRRAGGDRVRRRDERIRAVVEVEQRSPARPRRARTCRRAAPRRTSSDVSATYGRSRCAYAS